LHQLPSAQSFRNQAIQCCVADGLKQWSAYRRISQFEKIFKSSIHERDLAPHVNHKQTILHRSENCSGSGFTSCDLLIEFLLTPKNIFKRQPDAPSSGTTIDKKSAWPFAVSYLPNELIYVPPRGDPLSPGDERDRREYDADYTQEQPRHLALIFP
jgi:hypothetical protein